MWADSLSTALGWIYFTAWSISFYPQVILNYRRKSVAGLSLEYQMYNITGFTFYAIYTITNYIQQHNLGLTESVSLEDIVFAVHACFIQSIIVFQCVIYKFENHTINKWHMYLCVVFWILALYNVVLSAAGFMPWCTQDGGEYHYNTVEFLGYVKAMISFVKYTPQAYMNWSRKSTVGWSIGNVLLDITGGSFSFAQQFVDAYRQDTMSVFTKNIPKLILSVESVAFDILFILQHYVFYRHNRAEAINDNGPLADFIVVNGDDNEDGVNHHRKLLDHAHQSDMVDDLYRRNSIYQ